FLDGGSGIRELGLALENEFGSRPINLSLLITHVHLDHIQGFPFFVPSYDDKNKIQIFGYDGTGGGLREILKGQMATPFFPVALYDLPGKIKIEKLETMDFKIGKVRVRSRFMNHPGVCVGYRLFTRNGSLSTAISLARDASVRKLILFHHDPTHDDDMIDKMVRTARKLAAKSESYLEVEGAREGVEITLD